MRNFNLNSPNIFLTYHIFIRKTLYSFIYFTHLILYNMCPWPQCLGFRQPAAIRGGCKYEPRRVVPEGKGATGHPLPGHQPQRHHRTSKGLCRRCAFYLSSDWTPFKFNALCMGAETCSASRSMFWLCLGTRVTLCTSSLNRSRSALCTSSLLCPVFSIRPHICTRYSVQSCLPVQIIHHIVLILAAIALWRVCPFVCVRLRICVKVCADMFVSVGAQVLSEGESRESKSANYLRVNQTWFPAHVFNKLYLFLRVFTGNHCWHCFYLWRQDMGSGVPHWPLASTTSHISPSTSCSRNTGCQLPPTDALNSWTAWWRKQRWLLLAPIDQSRVYSL